MRWMKICKSGSLPKSAGRISRAAMEQRKAWAREIVREAKRNGMRKEGTTNE